MSDVVDAHASTWAERGAAPSDLLQLLAARRRSSAEVAALLGCTRDEAEALLWGLGFTHDDDDDDDDDDELWTYRGDEVSELIAGDIALSFTDAVMTGGDVDALQDAARKRLEHLLTEGTAPPVEDARAEIQRRLLDGPDT